MTTVAIMQPTFVPWLGYFALAAQCDVFVLLDDVQFSKRSWQRRNRIKGPNGEIMLSVGVDGSQSRPKICDVKLSNNGFETGLLKTIHASYQKAPFLGLIDDLLVEAFRQSNGSLFQLNKFIISSALDMFSINCELKQASELPLGNLSKADHLMEISRHFGASDYLSPVGSIDYLCDHNPFPGAGINLQFLDFGHPEYTQLYGSFMSHLAFIDALANTGVETTASLIRRGVKPPLSISEVMGQVDDPS